MRERVLMAMSGGVDSTVAAALLVEQGYDVVGVTLHLWDYPEATSEKGRCCAPEDQHDARRAADFLGIPHYSFDRRELFEKHVVAPFVEAYLSGTTPSPCVSCNRTVKMRELFPLARQLGARFVATGHYARVESHNGKAALLRGVDRSKDQSYFLHMLTSEELDQLLLPLGGMMKPEVRAAAVSRNLPGAHKGESQELCFIGAADYAGFVEKRGSERRRPGSILDDAGKPIAEHRGIHAFTVGQRKGLGVAVGKPVFVTNIDAESGAVQLGSERELYASAARLEADTCVWHHGVTFPLRADVRIRYRTEPQPATLVPDESGNVIAQFDQPIRAITPGQVAVAYQGERVVGGGTIAARVA